MCGIIGTIKHIPNETDFLKACQSLSHRGPDDSGLFYDGAEQIALGQCRLSIIDLSADGHQPFYDASGRYVLVFNGEIYNYIELRDELKNSFSFRTQTDTEVILAAYLQWGKNCLERFNGMFAFALWDKETRELFCARDRVGIKPFFYTQENGGFSFASEIKGLLALGIPKKANESIIFDYLRFGLYDHRSETFFEGIYSLPAGHFLTWKNEQVVLEKYWDLGNVKPTTLSDPEIRNHFEFLLSDAVRLQFRSDVPVGINLSSGLDSNSLLAFGRKAVGDHIHTFSMCLSDEGYNECDIIQHYSHLGDKNLWHQSYFEPTDLLTAAREMNKIQDQPYGGIPTIIYTSINKEAQKQGVTVLLEGQGIDEMLAGYRYYRADYEKDLGKDSTGSLALSQDGSQLSDSALLSSEFLEKHASTRIEFPKPFSTHLLNAQYRDFVFTKMPRVLRFNDHVSMAYGRELRVPFLDHRIAEFCFSLPPEYKIKGENQKVLMRETMQGQISADLLSAQKKTFGAVQNVWLRYPNYKKEVIEILHSDSFRSRGYWNYENLMKRVECFYNNEVDNSFFLWQCINLELWFREFID